MATETAGGSAASKLWTAVFFVVGCVLIFAGYMIRGLDFGSCPVMGYNVVSSCIHMFPGTDIPITPAGNMVMILGGVLIVSILVLTLYPRLVSPKASS